MSTFAKRRRPPKECAASLRTTTLPSSRRTRRRQSWLENAQMSNQSSGQDTNSDKRSTYHSPTWMSRKFWAHWRSWPSENDQQEWMNASIPFILVITNSSLHIWVHSDYGSQWKSFILFVRSLSSRLIFKFNKYIQINIYLFNLCLWSL